MLVKPAGPASDAELDALEAHIDEWLAAQLSENPIMVAVDRGEPGERRWYVRLRGDEKDFTTVWLTLGQRTLQYETYVMPAPEENHARVLRAPAAPQRQARRSAVLRRSRERGVPRRLVPRRRDRRRGARPHRWLALRVRRAVLPSGAADWLRVALCLTTNSLLTSHIISCHSVPRPEGTYLTGSGKSGEVDEPSGSRIPAQPGRSSGTD